MASAGDRDGVSLARTLFVLCWAGAAVVAWSRQPYLLDDAFITFRYGANWAAGQGPVFNPGERVEGYTTFLWMALSALVVRAGLDPLVWMRALGVLCYAATVGLCADLVWRLRDDLRDRLALSPLLLALVLPDGLAGFAGTGMETPVVPLLLVLTGLSTFRWTKHLAWGLFPLLLLLARMDMAPAVAIAFALCLAARDGARLRAYALAFAAYAVYLGWKIWYYGDLLPNTYYAKVPSFPAVAAGLAYLGAYARSAPQAVLFLVLAGLATLRSAGPTRRFLAFVTLALLAHAAYVVKVGGDFMQYRFMVHVYALAVAGAIVGLDVLARGKVRVVAAVAVLGALLSLRPAVLETRYHMESLPGMDACCAVTGIAYGRALARALPKDTVISTTMAGGLPYYSGLRTVDEFGLNDRGVALEGVPAGEPRRGHVRYATDDYLRRRGVNLAFHHPVPSPCAAPAVDPRAPNVFIHVLGGTCVRALYLNPTPELTGVFCTHPETFVLRGVTCPAS